MSRPDQVGNSRLAVLEIAATLRELTAGMIRCTDFDQALQHLALTTRFALPGLSYASVCILRAGQPASVAASDPLIKDLDELQYAADGPAMTAIRDREIVLVTSLAETSRWPDWSPAAVDGGIRAVLCAPVDVDDEVIGSINLYADRDGALADGEQLTAMLLAEHAGLLLGAVRDRGGDQRGSDLAGDGWHDSDLIGPAIGIVMTQRRCRAGEALDVLRDAAQATAIPLSEVAERLVASVQRLDG
ncbi:GAF and ANTAR domain-containing protein [Micromonospora sp. LOL_023]|uniref:GAF and ANTAR domain-containing protein n=1 Tax=Micromonospora sp. LOL_023 TaxID=3345418 RepID=UPI003A8860DE